jgi:hypothetical protein
MSEKINYFAPFRELGAKYNIINTLKTDRKKSNFFHTYKSIVHCTVVQCSYMTYR